VNRLGGLEAIGFRSKLGGMAFSRFDPSSLLQVLLPNSLIFVK